VLHHDVCAVVVTYNPDAGFLERLACLVPQVEAVAIVDNTPDSSVDSVFEKALEYPTVSVRRNGKNVGLASALNQGIEVVMAHRPRWVLTLDQDTKPGAHMVDALLVPFRHGGTTVGIVGTNIASEGRRSSPLCRAEGYSWAPRTSVITSGSLISSDALTSLGPLCSFYFIDHIDTEYCLRAKRNGFQVLAIQEPVVKHAIGAPTRHSICGRATATSNHSALRRYYISRNLMITIRRHSSVDPWWACRSILAWLKGQVLVLCFESDKRAKLLASARGSWHGLRYSSSDCNASAPNDQQCWSRQ